MSMLNALILCEPPNDKKIVADWTAKAGCTIAMKMLFTYMNVLEEALAYKHPRKWVHDFRQDVYYDRYGRVTEEIMIRIARLMPEDKRGYYTDTVEKDFIVTSEHVPETGSSK